MIKHFFFFHVANFFVTKKKTFLPLLSKATVNKITAYTNEKKVVIFNFFTSNGFRIIIKRPEQKVKKLTKTKQKKNNQCTQNLLAV